MGIYQTACLLLPAACFLLLWLPILAGGWSQMGGRCMLSPIFGSTHLRNGLCCAESGSEQRPNTSSEQRATATHTHISSVR